MKYKGCVNPDLMSDKPTHLFDGVKIKIFTFGMYPCYSLDRERIYSAEIMEGENKGKYTTAYSSRMIQIKNDENDLVQCNICGDPIEQIEDHKCN